MELDFLGHACIALTEGDDTLLVDPYEHGQFGGHMAYRAIDFAPQFVVCTHSHIDHAAIHAVPGTPRVVVDGPAGPFRITRYALAHDEAGGRRRGGVVGALRIETANASVLHLSDVGEAPVSDLITANRGVDVLLVPVGGMFTIGAAQAWEWIERIAPRVAIPIHYRTAACTLPLRDLDPFRAWVRSAVTWNSSRIHVHETLPDRLILPPRLG